ncbi:MAG: hypothetical protein ACXVFK_00860 [Solirubrobacteraceae bacterium]
MLGRALLASLCAALLAPAAALAHGSVTHADTAAELASSSIVRALRTARDASTGLPTTWCGTRQTTDDVVHAAQPPGTAVVKVVYAYAADQADRSATWSDALQGDVSIIGRFLAEQSGGRKAISFDMGTSCGPQDLDITVVPLPRAAASYTGAANFPTLRDDVLAALGTSVAPRDVLIMADQLSGGGTYGLGELISSKDNPGAGADRPGLDNPHNLGGLSAAIYSAAGSTPDATGWWPTGMLHEITHNLGAVQYSAPHATPAGHCWDGTDVMCYDDGSSGSQPYSASVCPAVAGAIGEVYDCGHDDYFDPAPAPGSYLDTHWDVYRSAFMAPCTDLGDACAALGHVLAPPVNTTAPRIAGTPQVGQVLTVDDGSWLNAPASYTVTWQHELSGGVWQELLPHGATWSVGLGDLGLRLRAVVTAANGDGSAVAVTAPTDHVAMPPAEAPAPAAAPSGVAPWAVAAVPAAAPGLRIALRRGSALAGRLTVAVRRDATSVQVRSAAVTARVRGGRWRLKLCAAVPGLPRRCGLSRRAAAARGRVRLGAVRVTVRPTTGPVIVSAALVDSRARSGARGSAIAR